MNVDEDLDSIWDNDSARSDVRPLKSARAPTVQELNAQIIRLERENFQLKLRVHLNETRGSIAPITATVSSQKKSEREVGSERDVEALKEEKEELECQLKLRQSELEEERRLKLEALKRESSLYDTMSELKGCIQILEREKAFFRPPSPPPRILSSGSQLSFYAALSASKAYDEHGDVSSSSPLSQLQNPDRDTPQEDLTCYHKYNQALSLLHINQDELNQVRAQLDAANYERLNFRQQLTKWEEFHQQELTSLETQMTAQIEEVERENRDLKLINEELQSSLKKGEGHLASLKKAADFELSNQLFYHQTALEKVHQEQALLIAELQNLKRSCPIQKPVMDLCKGIEETEAETEIETLFTEIKSKDGELTCVGTGTAMGAGCGRSVDTGAHRLELPVSLNTTGMREERISDLNKKLHEKNSKLAIKLKATRESLKHAIAMLEHSEKDKEGMEKIICRQLHKTHVILANVKGALDQSKKEKALGEDGAERSKEEIT